MSQENVDLSRRVIDAFNRHDPEAMVALCDPKCEWLPAIEAEVEGEPVVYRDHAEVLETLGLSEQEADADSS